MKYSVIVPVFNRPDECRELLESLCEQSVRDFEVVIVDDGSSQSSAEVCEEFATRLPIHYYYKPNSGPGSTRNYAAERAAGEWLIVLDSDCVLPPDYLKAVDDELSANPCEAFGGPDRAHDNFTPTQKAINYSMTSFFTTGGIRGGKKKLDKFYPRSFNMGVRADLYRQLGGFSAMRFGEDIDFSIRIFKSGARCRLFPEAWVWHKRRTDFSKFFRQVHNSGIARINLLKRHPGSMKLVHVLPAAFTVGVSICLLFALLGLSFLLLGFLALLCHPSDVNCVTGPALCIVFGTMIMCLSLSPLLLYALLVCTDSAVRNRSLWIGLLSVRASFTQLIGYGTGFIRAWWLRCVCGRDEELQAFKKNFYA